MKVKQVLILAAGEGQRMRPLTNDRPKPLIEVNGISMLDRILKHLEKYPQINKIVINGFYLSEKIENHLKFLNNKKIIFSKETEKLETGGGLLQALNFLDQTQPLLIINADIVWQNSDVIETLLTHFDPKKMDILLGLKNINSFPGYDGDANFTLKNGVIYKEKTNDLVYIGLNVINLAILQNLQLPTPPFSLNYFFAPPFRVHGIELNGEFFHIGTPEALKSLSKFIN